MAHSELVESLKGKLIVSVQAYPGEPMRHPETMAQIARACELGGAAAIRCQGLSDISALKAELKFLLLASGKRVMKASTLLLRFVMHVLVFTQVQTLLPWMQQTAQGQMVEPLKRPLRRSVQSLTC